MAANETYSLLLTLADANGNCQQGIRPEAVRVSYGPQYVRKPHPADMRIEESWASALAANPKIFDGSKFRLQHIAWAEGGTVVEMKIGLTGYKEYLGTNRLEESQRRQLEEDGERAHNDRSAHLSNALGCEAVLLTSDDQVVFLRRSASCGINTGQYNGPSGHPEPSHAAVEAAIDATVGVTEGARVQDVEVEAEVVQRVCHELFDSVLQEIHEETNVPLATLSAPRLIGCMADFTGKPDVLFLVRSSLDAAAVQAAYAKGAAEGWESDHLTFLSTAKLTSITLPLTATTRAAVACFLSLPPTVVAEGRNGE